MEELYAEMEEIFSGFKTDECDRIKTSTIINACKLRYNLNEELIETLMKKLDPDNVDKEYSKDDLYLIFKNWISCDRLNEPKISSVASVCNTSTPLSSRPKRHFRKKICLPEALFNEEMISDVNEVDTEESARGSGHSSSQRLHVQKNRLESRLETSERHASSLERRCESMTNLCERQSIEIDRLKQELKMNRDREQTIKDDNEQMSQALKETRAKNDADMSSMRARVEELNKIVKNLNQDASSSGDLIQKLELNIEGLMKKNSELEQCLIEKEKTIEDTVYKLNRLNENNIQQQNAVAVLTEENLTLTCQLDEIKANNAPIPLRDLSPLRNNLPYHIQNMGIPLCEELPSDMLIAQPGSSLSDSVFLPVKKRSLVSSECQTEFFMPTGCQIDVFKQFVSTECQTNLACDVVSTGCQTIVLSHLESTGCQTEAQVQLVSTECQTYALDTPSSSQIDASFQLVSTECQTDTAPQSLSRPETNVLENLVSSECQTISPALVSSLCQTDGVPIKRASCQTNAPPKLVSSKCQTTTQHRSAHLFSMNLSTSLPAQVYQTNMSEPLNSVEYNDSLSPRLVSTNCQMTKISTHFKTLANFVRLILTKIFYKFLDTTCFLLITLILCICFFFMLTLVCQNNQCVPQLRYSKPPPV